jgi:hypothetical protein
MLGLFTALAFSRKRYITYPRDIKPIANAEQYYVTCDALNVRSGPGTGYSKIGMLYNGATLWVNSISGGWASFSYNGRTAYVCADYIAKSGGGGGGSWPPSNPIRQGNPGLNSNINRWGCAFMSCCWLGKINSVSGCTNAYNTAVNRGAMRSDCYILSWDAMKCITGAYSYRWGGRNESPRSNEKEILWCKNSKTTSHFIVGNGRGSVEYDPAAAGWTAYSDHVEKRFYAY